MNRTFLACVFVNDKQFGLRFDFGGGRASEIQGIVAWIYMTIIATSRNPNRLINFIITYANNFIKDCELIQRTMRRVLIDFDGVVYNNHKTFSYVNSRSVKYTADRLKVSYSQAAVLNLKNYKLKGHTIFATDTSIQDYNDYVFNEYMISDVLYNQYEETDTIRLRHLVHQKAELDLDLILCTNAPLRYCDRILELSGFKLHDVFSPSHYFTSDSVSKVKPDPAFFEYVQSKVDRDGSEMGPLWFYDDSSVNIAAAQHNTKWLSVLFEPSDDDFHGLATH